MRLGKTLSSSRGFSVNITVVEVTGLLLVDLLNGWSGGPTTTSAAWCSTRSREAAGHATRHSSWHPTGALVQFGDDGVAHLLQLFLVMFVLFLLSSLGEKWQGGNAQLKKVL